MSFIVAIDGPAGTGKGAVTSRVAKKMNLISIDTGATYRCVALETINKNVDISEKEKIIEISKNIDIELTVDGKVYLNKQDVSKRIRENDVTNIVSQVSSIPEVRENMVKLQRKIAQGKDVIMEGRDITTVVFPNADVKIYLDADIEERAKRRYNQNKEKGINIPYEEVLENIRKRDENDKNKEVGALKIAEDAIVIDTTNVTLKENVKKVLNIVKEKKKEIDIEKKIYYERPNTKWKMFEAKVVKGFLGFLYRLVYRVKFVGKENIPEQGACIICANHLNYLDAAAVVIFNKRKVRFIAKEDLFHSKLMNWLAHVFDIIPIKRGKQDMESMKRSMKALKDGEILGIFPEGTRKGIAKNVKVKNGAAFMAIRNGVSVIPVGIQGSFKPFSTVTLNYGKPIKFEQQKSPEKDYLDKASEQIMEQIIMLTNQKV